MDDDEQLQDQVANAMGDGQQDDSGADENTDFQETGAQGDDNDGDSNQDGQGDEDQGNKGGSQQDDDELGDLDDDDDDISDYVPPALQGAGQDDMGALPQTFDIKMLRGEDGSIDPVKANEAIQAYAQQVGQAMVNRFANQSQSTNETAVTLERQWHKGIDKYPGVAKNKTLAKLARDIHLNSISAAKNGTGRYLTPIAAMRKVAVMQQRIAKTGYNSAKTRRTVVKTGQSEQGGGKGGNKPVDAYTKARQMATSSDPNVAKQGRMKIMELRRAAREK